jgi:single-strand DNA-binding protein
MNLNHVQLAGRLTRDPDSRYTQSGVAIADMGIAVSRFFKNDQGETKEETDFIDVTAFGRTAEIVQKHLRKGSPIYVEGRLKLDQWDDKQTGAKRTKLKVVAESMQFVGPRVTVAPDSASPPQPPAAAPPARAASAAGRPTHDPDLDAEPSDLPF